MRYDVQFFKCGKKCIPGTWNHALNYVNHPSHKEGNGENTNLLTRARALRVLNMLLYRCLCNRAACSCYWFIRCCWWCAAGLLLARPICSCCFCISSLSFLLRQRDKPSSNVYLRRQTIMGFSQMDVKKLTDQLGRYFFFKRPIEPVNRCHMLIWRRSRRTMWFCCVAKNQKHIISANDF